MMTDEVRVTRDAGYIPARQTKTAVVKIGGARFTDEEIEERRDRL
jgi:hypothetical protein